MKEKARKIVIDDVEIMTSLSAFEIADLPIKYEELKKENKQLKEKLEKERKVRKEAIKYINVTEYSDIVGLNNNGIKEFWFVKDLLEILNIDKGE